MEKLQNWKACNATLTLTKMLFKCGNSSLLLQLLRVICKKLQNIAFNFAIFTDKNKNKLQNWKLSYTSYTDKQVT